MPLAAAAQLSHENAHQECLTDIRPASMLPVWYQTFHPQRSSVVEEARGYGGGERPARPCFLPPPEHQRCDDGVWFCPFVNFNVTQMSLELAFQGDHRSRSMVAGVFLDAMSSAADTGSPPLCHLDNLLSQHARAVDKRCTDDERCPGAPAGLAPGHPMVRPVSVGVQDRGGHCLSGSTSPMLL